MFVLNTKNCPIQLYKVLLQERFDKQGIGISWEGGKFLQLFNKRGRSCGNT